MHYKFVIYSAPYSALYFELPDRLIGSKTKQKHRKKDDISK